jgi:RNA recognition motif-containing protein
MGKKLFVGNLSFDTTTADLEALFAQIGACESAAVVTDRATGRSRGFGFVEMASASDAQKAIAELNGRELHGRTINVNEAREREGGGGGFRRGGGGGGGGGRRGGGGFGGRSSF